LSEKNIIECHAMDPSLDLDYADFDNVDFYFLLDKESIRELVSEDFVLPASPIDVANETAALLRVQGNRDSAKRSRERFCYELKALRERCRLLEMDNLALAAQCGFSPTTKVAIPRWNSFKKN
jgi:hypothetical protein